MNTLIYTPRRCPPRRVLLTVSKWRRRALTVLAILCMALPLGIAAAGNVAGIR